MLLFLHLEHGRQNKDEFRMIPKLHVNQKQSK